jgi:hypothetical protein
MIPDSVPDVEWIERTALDRPPLEAMADPVWRLANIYWIYDKGSKKTIRFVPKPEQKRIIWDLFVLGLKNIIIPKARQIGFSTLLFLIGLDFCLFMTGAKCALIDKTKGDGTKKMNDMARVAWDRLPAGMREAVEDYKLTGEEFAVRLPTEAAHAATNGEEDDTWSRFRVEKSGRGDALTFLWISEWGTIQFDEPKRSTEILTGGMEAAEGNIRVIETTWKGGEGGDVWTFIEMALSKADGDKTPADWFIRFFPWWVERRYTTPGSLASMKPRNAAYLDEMEKTISEALGRHFSFTVGQRVWYDATERRLGLLVKREYPTVLSECWEAPVEGAIYADAVATALAEGRMQAGLYDPRLPVYTSWDLGAPQNLVCWYFQIARGRLRWIDVDMKLILTTRERVERMHAKGYTYAKHLLPHDAASTGPGSLTFHSDLVANGLENVVVCPRPADIEPGINRTLTLFPHFEFDPETCADGIKALKAYHRDDKTNEPLHDWSSHSCDAIRVTAEAASAGLISLDSVEIPTVEYARYFDTAALDFYHARAVQWVQRLEVGKITKGQYLKTDAADGWLRVWEKPLAGQSYLLAAVPGVRPAVGVWRNAQVPILSCALMADLSPDMDRLANYIAQMSRWYGGCLVIPAIDDASGLVTLLQQEEAGPVWMREEVVERRTLSRGVIPRKPGYVLNDLTLAQLYASLRARVRERSLEVGAQEFFDQASFLIEVGKALPAPAPGHHDEFVRMTAMAVHHIGAATEMMEDAPMPSVTTEWLQSDPDGVHDSGS